MSAESSRGGSDSAAHTVLRAALNTETVSDAQIGQYHRERLQDRRIQITNLDRVRPRAGGDDNNTYLRAERKLNNRKRRVKGELSQLKRIRIAAGRDDCTPSSSLANLDENVTGKQRHISDLKRQLKRMQRRTSESHNAKKVDKGSLKQLSRTQRKRMGLEDIDDNITAEIMKPLHDLWCSYIQQLLNMVIISHRGELVPNPNFDVKNLSVMSSGNVTATQASLVKADLCGAELEVARSANPSLVSQRGLVVRETERTIVLAIIPSAGAVPRKAAKGKNVRVIPKHNTVFTLFVPVPEASIIGSEKLRFELHGSHMMHTLPSRATRKYKARPTIDF